MLKIATDYHNKLQDQDIYTTDETLQDEHIRDVLQNLSTSLAPAKAAALDKEISYDDVSSAVRNLPNGKSPGMDGIPHEFYKILMDRHTTGAKKEIETFDIIETLKKVYNNIEIYGIRPGTNFSEGWMCQFTKKKTEQK